MGKMKTFFLGKQFWFSFLAEGVSQFQEFLALPGEQSMFHLQPIEDNIHFLCVSVGFCSCFFGKSATKSQMFELSNPKDPITF